MRTGSWLRLGLIGPCLALLVACGGNSEEGGGSSSDEESPLSAIFGGGESTAEMRAKDLEREQVVADCMNELGWEYTPVDWSAQFSNEEMTADMELSPEEYGKKYFYGVTRNYELYELPGLLGEEPAPALGGGDGFVDPNSEYVQSLSPEEQEQYYADLWGEQTFAEAGVVAVDDTAADTVYTPPPLEEQGCSGRAQQEVYGASPFDNPDMQTRLNELFEDLENDASVKAAQREWASCMTDKNPDWEMADMTSPYQYLERRKYELSGQEMIETDFDTSTGEPLDESIDMSEVYNSSYDDDGSGYVVIGQPEPLSEDQVEQLRADEKELWTADQSCQEENDLAEVRREAEQKLADTLLQEFPELERQADSEGE